MHTTRHRRLADPRLQRGLTLIEWMVAITLGGFLVVALLQLLAQQSLTQTELTRSSRQIENGRYAIQVLSEDLQLAGYYGELGSTDAIAQPSALPDPCALAVADIAAAMRLHVQAYDLSSSTLPSALAACVPAANHLDGTDVIVVRRAETSLANPSPLTVGYPYLQTGLSPSGNAITHVLSGATSAALASNTAFNLLTRTGTAAPLRAFRVHVYFVSPCNVATDPSGQCSSSGTDDGGLSIPTLKRLELSVSGGSLAWSVVPLVEGIENLQFEYGVDSLVPGDGVPDTYSSAPALADLSNIVSVRIHLLARNLERSAGHVDSSTYSLGAGVTVPAANDGFKRRVFSQTVRLVNPSSRRES